MKVGAEPKKIGVFVALLLVAGIVYWMNSSDTPSTPAVARPAADGSSPAAAPAADGINSPQKKRYATGRPPVGEIVYKRPDAVDPGKVDATLRLDLLAKVQAVNVEGGTRNLFEYCKDCPPPQTELAKSAGPVPTVGHVNVGPQPTPPPPGPTPPVAPPPPPGPPPAAPINLKYYGYSTKRSDGEKKAFFLDGEDIIVAAEGEMIKKQYKVVRIGVNSVQMEDTTSKSTQTLPIQQDAPV